MCRIEVPSIHVVIIILALLAAAPQLCMEYRIVLRIVLAYSTHYSRNHSGSISSADPSSLKAFLDVW